ncbi:RND transporter [Candidatus Magnetoovum chiemensis]|nr:RND transporter [Candidatus Magnetoovum chiemensis]
MNRLRKLNEKLPWGVAVILCLTLGLAPFAPPHIVEKMQMLFTGTLVKPIDWFDLLMHATPWALLAVKVFLFAARRSTS